MLLPLINIFLPLIFFKKRSLKNKVLIFLYFHEYPCAVVEDKPLLSHLVKDFYGLSLQIQPEIRKTIIQVLRTFLVAAEKKTKTFLPKLDENDNVAQNEVEGSLFHQEAASNF